MVNLFEMNQNDSKTGNEWLIEKYIHQQREREQKDEIYVPVDYEIAEYD